MAAFFKFGVNSTAFRRGLARSKRQFQQFTSTIRSAAAQWTAAFVGVGTALGAIRGALSVDQLGRDLNITTEEAFRLATAARAAGLSIEDVRKAAQDIGQLNVEDQINRMGAAFNDSAESATALASAVESIGDAFRGAIKVAAGFVNVVQKGVDNVAALIAAGGNIDLASQIAEETAAERVQRAQQVSGKTNRILSQLRNNTRRSVLPGGGGGSGSVNTLQRIGGFRRRAVSITVEVQQLAELRKINKNTTPARSLNVR